MPVFKMPASEQGSGSLSSICLFDLGHFDFAHGVVGPKPLKAPLAIPSNALSTGPQKPNEQGRDRPSSDSTPGVCWRRACALDAQHTQPVGLAAFPAGLTLLL